MNRRESRARSVAAGSALPAASQAIAGERAATASDRDRGVGLELAARDARMVRSTS